MVNSSEGGSGASIAFLTDSDISASIFFSIIFIVRLISLGSPALLPIMLILIPCLIMLFIFFFKDFLIKSKRKLTSLSGLFQFSVEKV